MPKKATGVGEELINHYGLVRLRVNGSGLLRMSLLSLDEVQSDVLANLTMQATTDVEPTQLANFTSQRARLLIQTTGLGETFQISKVIVFIRPVANSYPQ